MNRPDPRSPALVLRGTQHFGGPRPLAAPHTPPNAKPSTVFALAVDAKSTERVKMYVSRNLFVKLGRNTASPNRAKNYVYTDIAGARRSAIRRQGDKHAASFVFRNGRPSGNGNLRPDAEEDTS